MSIYVRIKRNTETYFEDVDPTDSFLSIKQRLAAQMNIEAQNIQLWHPNQVYLSIMAAQSLSRNPIFLVAKGTGRYGYYSRSRN